jgi:4-amino-4-deoxy-L-arabinose transferase-like glycosyltransferase
LSFTLRSSPARVTRAGAAKLPRAALLGLLAVYIVVGSSPHSPWPDEGIAFGAIWTMAHGHAADWWFPNVAGVRDSVEGPLPFWVGALFVRLLGGLLGDAWAARLTSALWFALATAALWYATFRFARRDEAQPVALAFGGQAEARDYGRMLADVSVLLLTGTLGIALRMHETHADAAIIAFGAVALFGVAMAFDHPRRGGLLCGIASAGLALSYGPVPAAGLLAGCCVALVRTGSARALEAAGARIGETAGAIATAVVVACLFTAAWPLAAWHHDPHHAQTFFSATPRGWWGPPLAAPGAADASWFARTGAWYLWPLWPLAGWAVYAWRLVRPAAHIGAPGCIVLGLLVGAAVSAPVAEPSLAMLVAPLAALAAFGGTTLRRAADNLMDWLAIVLFSIAMLFVWAYFTAMATGLPPRMAASISHLAPGWRETPAAGLVALAGVATAVWIALVARRAAHPAGALWRGPLLAAAGVTGSWVVIVALFMPAFDYTQSHRDLALEIAERLPWAPGAQARGACLQAHRLPLALRALIAYDGNLRFGRGDDGEACAIALQRISGNSPLDEDPPPGHPGTWRPMWDGHRGARPSETWRLWRRAPDPTR